MAPYCGEVWRAGLNGSVPQVARMRGAGRRSADLIFLTGKGSGVTWARVGMAHPLGGTGRRWILGGVGGTCA